MIPQAFITAWGMRVPWATADQIEQDLTLARLVAEFANDDYLGEELVFRGGTCLHMLHLDTAMRYSEDLDYVRRSNDPIGPVFDAVKAIGRRLDMTARSDVGMFPKVILRAPFESGSGTMRIKVEFNTYETSPARPLDRKRLVVESDWFHGDAQVQTFDSAELVATKLRALFQRSKGRDLFDLWLAVEVMGLGPEDIVDSFAPYRPDRYTTRLAEANLRAKLGDPDFRNDLNELVATWPTAYNLDAAAEMVIQRNSEQPWVRLISAL